MTLSNFISCGNGGKYFKCSTTRRIRAGAGEVRGYVSHFYEINKDDKSVGKLKSLEITITIAAYSSTLKLAEIVGHELNHYLDHYLGCYANWANSRGGDLQYAHYVSEVNAWNWSWNMNPTFESFYNLKDNREYLGTYK